MLAGDMLPRINRYLMSRLVWVWVCGRGGGVQFAVSFNLNLLPCQLSLNFHLMCGKLYVVGVGDTGAAAQKVFSESGLSDSTNLLFFMCRS